MSLLVYKSSAGSGKTTTLVNEYLSLALLKPERFGNIIALTFTIKATTEMKERVFSVLNKIINLEAHRDDAGLISGIEHIKERTKLSESEIQNRSKILLQNILHNYTNFSFSTIDSFVVNIVRSFAHDLNLPFDFNIELDSSLLIEQALAMLFEKIGKDERLTDFLIQYILQNVDNEGSLKIDVELSNLGKILFESRNYKSIDQLNTIDLEVFSTVNLQFKKDIRQYEKRLKKLAQEGLDLIEQNGIEFTDFSRKTLPTQLSNIIKGEINTEHKIFSNPEDDKFYTNKTSADAKSRIDSIRGDLENLINAIRNYADANSKDYTNKKLILEKLNPLALLSEIKRLLDQYSEENNIIHLSESNKMIADIVLNEHIPFIYERVGRKYLHFLVDEFQDTSVIQWNNLIPLIDNALATDNFNMIVGDAKQSIYRWRDGDVDQFINLPKIANPDSSPIIEEREESIKRNYEEKLLKFNYRSEVNIIEFNNAYFDFALNHTFGKKDKAYQNKDSERISKIYESHHQIPGKTEENGIVIMQNYPKDGTLSYEEGLVQHIESLIKQGYHLQDIAIIARAKKVLAKSAEILVQSGYSVVSNETLYLFKNDGVSLLTSLLNFIGNRDRKNNMLNIILHLSKTTQQQSALNKVDVFINKIGKSNDLETLCEAIASFEIKLSAIQLQEMQAYDLTEYLIRSLNINKPANPFIQSLLNVILENSQNNGAGLNAFLDFWELKKEKLSISLPDNIDAIKLYTIHKAKGLEFPVVIFAANGFSNNSKDTLHWVEPKKAGIEKLDLAMVKHKSEMEKSSFVDLFTDEQDKIRMDDLNLIYVATTRPTQQLIILFEDNRNSLWDKFKDFNINNDKYKEVDANLKIYGQSIPFKINQNKIEGNHIANIISNSWNKKVQIRKTSALVLGEQQSTRIEKGKSIHYLLSKIKTVADINTVVTDAIHNGYIKLSEEKSYISELKQIITHPDIEQFFKVENKEFNECSILLPNGKQMRPDKVIIQDHKTIIIDYKVSDYVNLSEREKQKHIKQVENYKYLLENMGYSKIKTHLIYIGDTIINLKIE